VQNVTLFLSDPLTAAYRWEDPQAAAVFQIRFPAGMNPVDKYQLYQAGRYVQLPQYVFHCGTIGNIHNAASFFTLIGQVSRQSGV